MAGVLSYQDLEEVGPARRMLYRSKNHDDDDFDAIMAQRRREAGEPEEAVDGADAEAEKAAERQEANEDETVGFGTGVAVDDELLKDLPVPPMPKLYRGFVRDLRPQAIFLTSKLFGLLPTGSILRWASTHLQSAGIRSEGLEWISDWSLVLVFPSQQTAVRAFERLLLHPDEIEGENGVPEAFDYLQNPETSEDVLEAAGEFILTHRPAKPLNPSLFTKTPFPAGTQPQDQVPFARFALVTDVKNRSARNQSLWYAVHGESAGKERDNVSIVPSNVKQDYAGKRKRRGSDEDGLGGRMGPRDEARPIRELPRRGKTDAERQAALDDELDRFMRGGGAAAGEPASEAEDPDDGLRRKKRRSSPGPGGPDLLPDADADTTLRADSLEDRITAGVVEEEVEVVDADTGEKVKKVSRRRRKAGDRDGDKEVWGSLFSRLT